MPIRYSKIRTYISPLTYPNHFRVAASLFLVLCVSYVLPYQSENPYIKTLHITKVDVLKAEDPPGIAEGNVRAEQIREVSVIQKRMTPTQTPQNGWGVSKQIDEHTWTITVAKDDSSATAGEIHEALNTYRQTKGVAVLLWDDTLAAFAQSRAASFATNGALDSHAGFQDYINNQDGFGKLGFNALGENSSFGFTLEGTHLIEWVYAGDKPHDDNQLNASWTHVGIGVQDTSTNLIFGGKKR